MESVTVRKRLSEGSFQFLTHNNTPFPIQSWLEIVEVKMHTLDTRARAKSKPLSPNECNQERIAGISERAWEDAIATNAQMNPNHSSPYHKQLQTLNTKPPIITIGGNHWKHPPSTFDYVYSTTFTTIKSSSPLFQPHEPPHPFKFLRTGGYTKQTECPSCTQNQLPF